MHGSSRHELSSSMEIVLEMLPGVIRAAADRDGSREDRILALGRPGRLRRHQAAASPGWRI